MTSEPKRKQSDGQRLAIALFITAACFSFEGRIEQALWIALAGCICWSIGSVQVNIAITGCAGNSDDE